MSISEQYIETVSQADIERLMGLFSPTASLFHPAGQFTDTDAIRNFYESVVFAGQAVTEIQAAFSDYLYAADVFRIQDGLIDRLDIYYR